MADVVRLILIPLCLTAMAVGGRGPGVATSQHSSWASGADTEVLSRELHNRPASPDQFDYACGTDNPYFVTVCYAMGPDMESMTGAVKVFRDTPDDRPAVEFDTRQQGTLYGLAYSRSAHSLFMGAYEKGGASYPNGTGAVYRLDLATRAVHDFAVVPDAGVVSYGADQHEPTELPYPGKRSLGDIDLSDDERTLYVANLGDRRIYRFDASSGALLGSFPHGASNETWSDDARPFGLKYWQGKLYHGVVNSAERSRDASELSAHVYESLADGSEMREVLSTSLAYPRGLARLPTPPEQPVLEVPLEWQPWRQGYSSLVDGSYAVYPQPMLTDIEFDDRGRMLLGFRDRQADLLDEPYGPLPESRVHPLPAGDLVLAEPAGAVWRPRFSPEGYYDRTSFADESTAGALARVLAVDVTVSSAYAPGSPIIGQPSAGVDWFSNEPAGETGNRLRRENVCGFGVVLEIPRAAPAAPIAPMDNERVASPGMGDIEVLCGPRQATMTPTPSPSASPAASSTATAPATSTPTATSTRTHTPKRRTVYLPVLIHPCDPLGSNVDVVLVIDASTSMREISATGLTKLAAAQAAARAFLQELRLPQDRVALVSFNERSYLLQGLTGDMRELERALAAIETAQYTRIDLGISEAHGELVGQRRVADHLPAMIVLTDGKNNPEPVGTAVEAAGKAKDDGIRVFAIGLGDEAEEEALEDMASSPGDYFHAPSADDLGEIDRRIARVVACPPGTIWPVGSAFGSPSLRPPTAPVGSILAVEPQPRDR